MEERVASQESQPLLQDIADISRNDYELEESGDTFCGVGHIISVLYDRIWDPYGNVFHSIDQVACSTIWPWYQWSPLHSLRGIRLLRLQPGIQNDILRVSLHHFTIEDAALQKV
jgi:hypothetical protein